MRYIFFAFLLFFGITATAQKKKQSDCSFLKHSLLKYLDIEDTTAYVVINENLHEEYHQDGKYFIKSKIVWQSDCEWTMTMTEITIPDFPFKPGEQMHVKITRIDNDIIYYTSTVNGQSWPGRFRRMKQD